MPPVPPWPSLPRGMCTATAMHLCCVWNFSSCTHELGERGQSSRRQRRLRGHTSRSQGWLGDHKMCRAQQPLFVAVICMGLAPETPTSLPASRLSDSCGYMPSTLDQSPMSHNNRGGSRTSSDGTLARASGSVVLPDGSPAAVVTAVEVSLDANHEHKVGRSVIVRHVTVTNKSFSCIKKKTRGTECRVSGVRFVRIS